jgi:hypothetical protein
MKLDAAHILLAAATTIWVGRREDLPARLPLTILLVIHASILLLGAHATIDGSRDRHEVPPLLSLFGICDLRHTLTFGILLVSASSAAKLSI